ncbi:hypothetical protein [Micromonospora sp. NPDC023633]|uniref:hypothetical protein n=1 Tax=Micromonospora sp. NPDC023633 TaxID=3154320 RepID=UPI0033FE5C34
MYRKLTLSFPAAVRSSETTAEIVLDVGPYGQPPGSSSAGAAATRPTEGATVSAGAALVLVDAVGPPP